MKDHVVAVGLAAIVVASGGLAVAGNSALAAGDSDKVQGKAQAAKTSAKTSGVLKCDGGPNLSMRSRIVDTPFTFVETGTNAEDQAIPGAAVKVKGPKKGKDTLLITFSAETRVNGGDDEDWMGLEVHRDGSPIEPHSDPSDPLAITGVSAWNGNSLQFCTKVGKGKHLIKAYANLYDSGANHSMDGWLDDYTLSVLRFD